MSKGPKIDMMMNEGLRTLVQYSRPMINLVLFIDLLYFLNEYIVHAWQDLNYAFYFYGR